jgi:diacylglycerol O-acyltransferase
MKRLSLTDDSFLRIESRRHPFHIGVLMLFELGNDAPSDFMETLVAKLKKSTSATDPFNRRVVRKRGAYYWQEDSQFDVTHNFAHVALPGPGRIRELLEFVSRAHASHLDRAFPMWRFYLIEGVEGGRFAVYFKWHHSLMDGIAGTAMLRAAMSDDIEVSKSLPAPWQPAPAPWQPEVEKTKVVPFPMPTATAGTLRTLRSLYRVGFKSIVPLYREVRRDIQDYKDHNPNLVYAGQAPRCILNQKISASRRFAAQSYSTKRMRAVASALNATLNDVVLAMCSSALRQYLMERNELPDKPLVAAVPLSLRKPGDTSASNEVAFMFTHLATHIDDPIERLRSIKACMDYNKQNLRGLTPAQTMAVAAFKLLPGVIDGVLGRKPDNALVSLCISHVRGPQEDTYWQGARLTGLYPASLVVDVGALNITVISRHDFVDFGLIACSRTVPRLQRLLDYLENGLTELEQAVALAPQEQAAVTSIDSASNAATLS